MKIKVKSHEIKITDIEDYNRGEYNIQECEFDFSNEYTGLSKIAVFSNDTETINITIVDDHCIVPSEMLENEGIVNLGVYAYEVEDDELKLRYSPKPICFNVEEGSYREGDQPTPPSPSVVEQLQQQITNNANNISSLQDLTASQGEQIETNTNDISAIKSEQTTQNNKIQANTEEIESINGIIPTLAKKTEIPTKVSQLENDSNYVTETEMSNAIDEEKTERENADIELQSQIDAITVSSDVVDVVGTYQELLDYDTSKLTDDDIIKVLVDSTHNDALSYYRWQITGGIGSWQYVGSEGPFYTKSETDSLLNEKQDEITNENKLDSDLVSDDGQTNKFVTTQEKNTWNNKQDALTFDNTPTENSNNPVKSGGIYDFVNTKLEDYVLETDFEESQSLQDEEIERNKMIYNAMPKVSGEGTNLTLNNTAECPVYDIELSPSELEQETTTGKNLFSGDYSQFDNTGGEGTTYAYFKLPDDNKQYTLTMIAKNDFTATANTFLGFTRTGGSSTGGVDWVITQALGTITKGTILSKTSSSVNRFVSLYNKGANYLKDLVDNFYIQLEEGSTATSYEPYTGNQPSPNPQYPQDIHVVSGENSVKVGNKNLFDEIYYNNSSLYSSPTSFARYFVYVKMPDSFKTKFYGNMTLKGTSQNLAFGFSTSNNSIPTRMLNNGTLINNVEYDFTNATDVYLIIGNSNDIVASRDIPLIFNNYNIMISKANGETYTPYVSQTYPLSLGDLEYCKIGDYEDEFYKATESDTGLTAGKWYLKKNIGKVVFDGNDNWAVEANYPRFAHTLNDAISLASRQIIFSNYFKFSASDNDVGVGFLYSKKVFLYPTTDITTEAGFQTWLSTHNTIAYYPLATPTFTLLNDTLQTQLDNISKAISYQEQTNVSQTNNDLPFIIKMSAIRDLSGIFELIQG